MDADERVAQNRQRSGEGTPLESHPRWGVSAAAGKAGRRPPSASMASAISAAGLWNPERDAGQHPDLGVGGFD